MTSTNEHIPPRRSGTARILHTSDWHLGVTVRNESRAVDHDARIAELIDIAEQAQPDLILHTGDLFDSARPPMPDLDRAIRALRRLAEIAPVSLLAGNHDSAGTLKVIATAVEDDLEAQLADGTWSPHRPCSQRIRVHHSIVRPERGLVTTYAGREGVDIRLACLPFVSTGRAIVDWTDAQAPNATYADSVRAMFGAVVDVAKEDLDGSRQVLVLASHVHIGGAKTSSERTLNVSETYAADDRQIPDGLSYLAFGHIHVPQSVAGGLGRYAGSLLEVDFGEQGEDKRVLVVDCEPGRPGAVKSVPLTSGRPLRRVEATLDQLATLADELAGSLAEVVVISAPDAALPLDDASGSLAASVRDLLPGTTVVQVIDARRRRVVTKTTVVTTEKRTTSEQLRDWLTGPGAGKLAPGADAERIRALFDVVLTAKTGGDDPVHPQQAAFDAMGGDR